MGLGRFSVCYEDTQVRLNLRRYSCIQDLHIELDKSCDIRLVNLKKSEKELALPKKKRTRYCPTIFEMAEIVSLKLFMRTN